MKPYYTLYLILLIGFFASCETEIPFEGKVTEPVLVVNCLACSDSLIQVNVTASRFFLTDEDTFSLVPNATVALYVNGQFTENLTNLGQGRYQSTHVPSVGEQIRLQATAPGFEPVWAEATLPLQALGFSIDSTITRTETQYLVVGGGSYGGGYDGGYNGGYGDLQLDTVGLTYSNIHQFKIHFQDVPVVKNYYRLIVKETSSVKGYDYINYQNSFDDLVFGEKKNNMDGMFSESEYDVYSIFSDELIDGKAHTITVYSAKAYNTYYLPTDTTNAKKTVSIDLQSIDESYYLYLKSLKALDIADPFMSEPVQIFTNIQGGLGIAGARTNQLRSFVLAE